jgi:hypothetical protein
MKMAWQPAVSSVGGGMALSAWLPENIKYGVSAMAYIISMQLMK